MKRLLIAIFFVILIFHGISFLMFVIKMILFPPNMMGMMMGGTMMYNQMFSWFLQTFWISLIIAGVILFIWAIRADKKEKRN